MIIQVSDYLKLHDNMDFQIEHIFNNSVNVSFKNMLYTLQNSQTTLTPLSIVFDALPPLSLNSRIRFKNKMLLIDDATYSLAEAEKISLKLKSNQLIKSNYEELLVKNKERSTLATWYFNDVPENPSLNEQYILEKMKLLNSQSDVYLYLSSLIGLGLGLTPSLDDFVIGLLLFLDIKSIDKFDYLSMLLLHHLSKTTLVSKHFLLAAINHYYSKPLLNMIEYPSTQNIKNVMSFGHSSGVDTLTGFVYGIKIYDNLLLDND